jgi:hypothetical protein
VSEPQVELLVPADEGADVVSGAEPLDVTRSVRGGRARLPSHWGDRTILVEILQQLIEEVRRDDGLVGMRWCAACRDTP